MNMILHSLPRCRSWLSKAFLFTALLAQGLSETSNQVRSNYFINVPERDPDTPIILPATYTEYAYADSRTAIDIVSITADGVEIAAEQIPIADRPDLGFQMVGESTILHQFGRTFLETWPDIEVRKQNTCVINRFSLPKRTKSIEIRYRIRAPLKSESAISVATIVTTPGTVFWTYIPGRSVEYFRENR